MVQEITTKSWGSRIINAFVGILVGLAMIVGAFILIFWNEGHALHTAQSLQEAEQVLIRVPTSPIADQNNMRVVYFTGRATTNDELKDTLLNLSEKAIKLSRKVEMYQWKEDVETKTEKNIGGSESEVKTYSYMPVWSDNAIDSSQFKESAEHKNPAMPVRSKTVYAKTVTVGDFLLPKDLVHGMAGDTAVDLKNIDVEALKTRLNKPVRVTEDGIYAGDDADIPKIGDLKISVTEITPQDVSVIAQQINHTLQPYAARAGQNVSLIEMGTLSPKLMIQNALSENAIMMWILRIVSFIILFVGLALLMQPVVVLADVIPFFGSLVGVGTSLVAFIGAIILWSIGLAIAWVVVRPLWSVAILVCAGVACWLIYVRKRA